MELNQFVQERLSRGSQQAQQLLEAASTFYRKRSQAPSLRSSLAGSLSVAAAYRRAYFVSRELQTPSS